MHPLGSIRTVHSAPTLSFLSDPLAIEEERCLEHVPMSLLIPGLQGDVSAHTLRVAWGKSTNTRNTRALAVDSETVAERQADQGPLEDPVHFPL